MSEQRLYLVDAQAPRSERRRRQRQQQSSCCSCLVVVISLLIALVALRAPLAFDPGTRWEYGIGIDWAGQMVERVSGMTLGEYFAEHVTGPLGMHATAYVHSPSMLERAAAIHARLPDGSLTPIDLPPPENPEFEMGGAGLNATMGFLRPPALAGEDFHVELICWLEVNE